jgi:hypothetical protein
MKRPPLSELIILFSCITFQNLEARIQFGPFYLQTKKNTVQSEKKHSNHGELDRRYYIGRCFWKVQVLNHCFMLPTVGVDVSVCIFRSLSLHGKA